MCESKACDTLEMAVLLLNMCFVVCKLTEYSCGICNARSYEEAAVQFDEIEID